MEKYSRWRDAGTGIQPFLPPVSPRTESNLVLILSNIIHYIVGPVQGIIKMALVAATALIYLLLVVLLGPILQPLGPIGRAWSRLWSTVLLRLVLFFSGFFYIKSETVTLRRGTGRAKSKVKSVQKMESGDIIVANWTSYIDVLYLAYAYGPVFTQVLPEGTPSQPEIRVCRISLWQALRLCSKVPVIQPSADQFEPSKLYTIKGISAKAKQQNWGPVVVFPEGTTSNGRALLKFAPVFEEFQPTDRNAPFHVLAFSYKYRSFSPTYTVGRQTWHYIKLCCQFYNTLVVKRLAKDDVPCSESAPLSQQANDLASLAGSDIQDLVGGQLSHCLRNMTGLRRTNLSMSDKRDFLEYYHTRSKKKAPRPSKKTN